MLSPICFYLIPLSFTDVLRLIACIPCKAKYSGVDLNAVTIPARPRLGFGLYNKLSPGILFSLLYITFHRESHLVKYSMTGLCCTIMLKHSSPALTTFSFFHDTQYLYKCIRSPPFHEYASIFSLRCRVSFVLDHGHRRQV